jgi:hypothetical protein
MALAQVNQSNPIIDEFRNFSFTIYRILPFIVVAFFFISSILSGDVSGFLILVGVILSSVITLLASKTQYVLNEIYEKKIKDLWDKLPETNKTADKNVVSPDNNKKKIIDSLKYCNQFVLGKNPLSYLPLSTHIYWFLSAYFVYVMSINNVLARNWFLLLSMSVLLVIDGYYNNTACVGSFIAIPAIIGAVTGVIWAVIVGPKNHMIPLLSQKSQCSAQTSRYSCRIKRTGQIVNA